MTQPKAVMRRRGGVGLYKSTGATRQNSGTKSKALPEYLDQSTLNDVLRSVQDLKVRLAMLIQWRAGLRVSEVASLAPADVNLQATPPELKVRQGKGHKDRIVPLHPELAGALSHAMYLAHNQNEPFIGVTRQTLDVWYRKALDRARDVGALPSGKPVTTHTFRHSAARHWLLSGVPLNVVSRWLGHSNLSTTMVYLQLISDPGGFMERVP